MNLELTELSDLFFNHTHEYFDALHNANDGDVEHSEEYEAILKDASDFVTSYPSTCNGVTAEELADDFMGRL